MWPRRTLPLFYTHRSSSQLRDLAAADAAMTGQLNNNMICNPRDVSGKSLDPEDPSQMLLIRMIGTVAKFELNRLAERRTCKITKAKANGKYFDRKAIMRVNASEVI